MADLIVKVDELKLDSKTTEALNREVQAAVLRVLADVDLSPKVVIRYPRPKEWLGIWIRYKDFNQDEIAHKFVVR
ncbi:MAG TPA: hypothetical protein VNB22_24940 [Pyrinomonadaceae bacterium]|nr:hypothetical protein [Pyrinomonadaceae bacterium]